MTAFLPCRQRLAGSPVVAFVLVAGAFSLAACSDAPKGSPPLADVDTGTKLIISSDHDAIPADATTTATLTVSGAQKFPLTLTTSLGVLTAPDGTSGLNVKLAGNGSVTLRSACSGAVDLKCGGEAKVQGIDDAGNRGETRVSLTVKENCANGLDDDGDKRIDCADKESCPAGTACANGLSCGTAGGCDACIPPNGKKSEAAEATCGDAGDNDCDGKIDCADSDCNDKACAFSSGGLGRCTGGACACAATVEICGNKIDDDCDGKLDCEDTDCQPGGTQQNQPCRADGKTCAAVPDAANDRCSLCPGGAVTESVCGDGKDNDCDGKLDCEDPDCAKLACGDGVGQICNEGKCVDTKTAFTLTVTSARPALPANGKATNVITVKIANTIKASITGQTVSLEIIGGAQWDSVQPKPVLLKQVKTDGAGVANATLVGGAEAGFFKVRAIHVETGNTAETTITIPSIASVTLTSIQFPVMGVESSGYQEESKLVYTITGSDGQPYPAGLDVVFEHEPRGGSTLEPGGVLQNASKGECAGTCKVILPSVSKEGGRAEVTLQSGTAADLVTVTLKTEAASVPISFTPPQSIAIVGARANWYNMAVSCSPGNVPGLLETNCTDSLIDEKVTCTVVLADRFKNALGLAKLANFYSEAGVVGPPPTTPPFDPTKKPSEQPGLGRAVEIISTLGSLPRDVAPNAGEYSRKHEVKPCGELTHNPRDGVVSIIAAVVGEEGFVDVNGDGKYGTYDDGQGNKQVPEPFVDLGEPFVDANDDGIHQDDEYFVDVDQNKQWTGPNGKWDDNTTIWAETRVTFSSGPLYGRETAGGAETEGFSRVVTGLPSPGLLQASPAGPSSPTPSPRVDAVSMNDGALVTIPVVWTDQHFNPLAPTPPVTFDTVKVGGGGIAATYSTPPLPLGRVEGHFVKQEFCDPTFKKCDAKCTTESVGARCLVRTAVSDFTHFSAGDVELKATGSTDPQAWSLTFGTTVLGKKPQGSVEHLLKLTLSGVTNAKPK